jgi:hypothetical protein
VVAGIFNCGREEEKFLCDGWAARVADLCFGHIFGAPNLQALEDNF